MAAKIYRSPFPDINLANSDLLSFLFQSQRNTPQQRPVFADSSSGETHTYENVVQRTKSLAHGLRGLGVQPGGTVAILSPNSINYPIFCYAILGCGATVAPISSSLTVREVRQQLQTSRATHIIVHTSLIDTARKGAQGTDITCIIQDGHRPALPSNHQQTAEELMTTLPASDLISTPEALLDTRPAFICFSSGTTGAAKGVVLTHRNLVANIQQWQELYYSDIPPSPTAIAFLPFSHSYAVNAFILGGLFRGTTVVVMPRFELNGYMKSIQEYRPSELHLVPPIALLLRKVSSTEGYDMSSVRTVFSAAAPLSPELGRSLEQRFKHSYGTTVYCHQAWGLTETSPLATGVPWKSMGKRHTVGCIAPNMKFRLVDPETAEDITDPSQGGEIWCHGPNVAPGYFNNEDATRDSFSVDTDGTKWFKTGDIAVIDREGFVTIKDRIKEMIKYKGLQVIPSELEAKLLEHSDIDDCGVTSIWDETQATELPLAFVVLQPQARSQPQKDAAGGIHQWINARVAGHKRLRGGIRFVDVIPKSPSGKILRRQLKEILKAESTGAKL